jgi:hypothetical protein
MDKKKALAQALANQEKHIGKVRRTWLFCIWFGYSAVAFWLLTVIDDIDDILYLLFDSPLEFLGLLLGSLFLGFISLCANAIVWRSFCTKINDLNSGRDYLEKEYEKALQDDSKQNDHED